MWEWLDRMREKPESVRLRFAILSAGLITALVVLIWLAGLYATGAFGEEPEILLGSDSSASAGEEAEVAASFKDSLRTLGESARTIIELTREMFPK